MQMQGYIKLHRQIIDSDIYYMPPLYLRVFERLIMEANHKDKDIPYNATKKLIKRGEKLTSYRQIARWVGWYERGIFKEPNVKTIKEILDWLVENNMIIISDQKTATHYKIINYDCYQGNTEETPSKPYATIGEPIEEETKVTENKQSTDTNKNDKNDKKYILIYNSYMEANITQHKSLTEVMKKAIDKTLKKYSLDDVILAIKRYSEMYHDKGYAWCEYKWSLNELLTREKGIGYFLDDGDKWINYCEFKKPNKAVAKSNNNGFDFSYFDK